MSSILRCVVNDSAALIFVIGGLIAAGPAFASSPEPTGVAVDGQSPLSSTLSDNVVEHPIGAVEKPPIESHELAKNDRLLVLGPLVQGRTDRFLRDGTIDRLVRLGQDVKAGEVLETRDCADEPCLRDLLNRQLVGRVLRIDVSEGAQRRYQLKIKYLEASGMERHSDSSCLDCSAAYLRGMISDLAAKTVTGEVVLSQAGREPSYQIDDSPRPTPQPEQRAQGSRARSTIAAAGSLWGISFALASFTILLGSTHSAGDDPLVCVADRQNPWTKDNLPHCIGRPLLLGIGGGLSALSGAAALWLTLNTAFSRTVTTTTENGSR